MKTYAIVSVFVCVVYLGFGQDKNYKNQINRTLTEKVNLQQTVEEKESKPSTQAPKYKPKSPNMEWADTVKNKSKNNSYKQHGGRPN